MLGNVAAKVFGSRNERLIRQLSKTVKKINALESDISVLSDADLKAKTAAFKERVAGGESLDKILPEAFAVTREASKRVLGLRHYDVQLIGGMVLHSGKIAEMRTGEGKTLVATLPVYLNALSGKGVHVVTVNDYLASRDGAQMAELYNFLGLSTGIIIAGMDNEAKKKAYRADITYGTNNEFGFDYLRSNMALTPEDRLQRELNYAIVDEVDSILIDEARTPLIISGPAEMDIDLYRQLNDIIVPELVVQKDKDGPGDFALDEKNKQITLTESGHDHVEKLLVEKGMIGAEETLYDPKNIGYLHHLNACLRAHYLFHKDVDYIVKNGEVIIVDEFTGRTMEGRRWSDGLHQAIEIKEGVKVQQETQTLASITYQNYFRLYDKLAGMTGTADTEAYEFQEIYKLETVVIPTNKPVIRKDYPDLIYLQRDAKFHAIVEDVRKVHAKNQPVLIGTASIDTSEALSQLFDKEGIKHNVLNAKQHAREAEIIAYAGHPGAVTIATNMAGRGTDIVLGGSLKDDIAQLGVSASDEEKAKVMAEWQKRHDEVIKAGGLHVIGAERHESRRIDNQLRGRSGRQGDPGSSRFYVALDDNLVRIFAGDKMANMMKRLGMSDDDAIESKMVSRQIEGAQKKVEAYNFDARKNLLEYDDVANEQRKVIYAQRNMIMDAPEIHGMVDEMRHNVANRLTEEYASAELMQSQWHLEGLEKQLATEFGLSLPIQKEWLQENPNLNTESLEEKLYEALKAVDAEKRTTFGDEAMDFGEKFVALQTIDDQWKSHLATMDMLRQGIWMRSRAQKDPKREYQRESFELFQDLLLSIQYQIVRILAQINFQQAPSEETLQQQEAEAVQQEAAVAQQAETEQFKFADSKENPYAGVGRNDPCPCGSGKKFKNCHGKLD